MSEDSGKKGTTPKDRWDKWQIILGPVGGLLTAMAVAYLTFSTSSRLGSWQERENNARVYTELMGKREEAETGVRKAMFDSIIGAFLNSAESRPSGLPKSLEAEVLKMELLAYNFHESLNLTPLFKHLEREIEGRLKADAKDPVAADCLRRLRRVANDIVLKQFEALKDSRGTVNATKFRSGTFQEPVTGEPLTATLTVGEFTHEVTLAITDKDPNTQELQVSLTARTSASGQGAEADSLMQTHVEFWIGSFDFPMIDNTRLPNDQRCALILRVLDKDPETNAVSYELHGVCFPGSRAALHDKPYYDEILNKLRQADSIP